MSNQADATQTGRDLAQIGFDLGHIAVFLQDLSDKYAPMDLSDQAGAWLRVDFLAGHLRVASEEVGRIASEMEYGPSGGGQ